MRHFFGYLSAFCFGAWCVFCLWGHSINRRNPVCACDDTLAERTLLMAAERLREADRDLRVMQEVLIAAGKELDRPRQGK